MTRRSRRSLGSAARIVAAAVLAIGILGLVPAAAGAGTRPKLPAVGAPRILYSSDWSGTTEIYAVDPSGRKPVAQLTFGRPFDCGDAMPSLSCGFTQPQPSPDGRQLLFRGVIRVPRADNFASSLWLAGPDGSAPRLLASVGVQGAAWSPDSRRIAYLNGVGLGNLHIVGRDGTHDQVLAMPLPFDAGDPAWSPDGRWLVVSGFKTAVKRNGSLRIVVALGNQFSWSADSRRYAYVDQSGNVAEATTTGNQKVIAPGGAPVWSPDGKLLAYEDKDGIEIFSSQTDRIRRLTAGGQFEAVRRGDRPLGLAWASDGRSLAYIEGHFSNGYPADVGNGDLRIVTLAGRTRTMVAVDRTWGGRMFALAWATTKSVVHYRPAPSAPTARVTTDGLLADGPIEFLAADGGRVAYSTGCDTIWVWTPATATTALARKGNYNSGSPEPKGPPNCHWGADFFVSGLALSADRIAWAEACCNNSKAWAVRGQTLEPSPRTFTLGAGSGGSDIAGPAYGNGSHYDSPTGSGSLLVFSSWQSAPSSTSGQYVVVRQSIVRAGPAGCPCPTLRTDPGPLILDDMDADHILAHGNNEIVVLDSDGNQLGSVPVKPAAAALSGGDLIVVVQGELHDYDWPSGTLSHSWSLSNAPTGPDCPFGINFGCPGFDHELPLRLQDAARGLVAYVLDDQVHLLRLSDGKEATIGRGTHARFMDAGLVYAAGSRLHLVPYDQLPLR
jgi:WD40-like Beta Propeller Repeat